MEKKEEGLCYQTRGGTKEHTQNVSLVVVGYATFQPALSVVKLIPPG